MMRFSYHTSLRITLHRLIDAAYWLLSDVGRCFLYRLLTATHAWLIIYIRHAGATFSPNDRRSIGTGRDATVAIDFRILFASLDA